MAVSSRHELEVLLGKRGWGATLRRSVAAEPGLRLAPGTITELAPGDAGGGGVTSLALHLVAGGSGAVGKVAWVDPADRLDPGAAARAGLEAERLLWVRGGDATAALRAAQLIVQAGGFSLIVVDLLDAPERELQLPRSTWFRLLRGLERERRAALLTLAPRPLCGSCADCALTAHYAAVGWNDRVQPLLEGAQIEVRVASARRQTPAAWAGVKTFHAETPRDRSEDAKKALRTTRR